MPQNWLGAMEKSPEKVVAIGPKEIRLETLFFGLMSFIATAAIPWAYQMHGRLADIQSSLKTAVRQSSDNSESIKDHLNLDGHPVNQERVRQLQQDVGEVKGRLLKVDETTQEILRVVKP